MALFREHWGYLLEEGVAPVLIGETGARMEDPEDEAYLDALFGYLGGFGDSTPGVAWWGWNPNSHDTGGLLGDDWRTLHEGKLAYLDGLDPSPLPASEAALERFRGETRTLVLEADAAKGHERVFTYEVTGGTATEGVDFAARDGVIHLMPGETRAEIGLTVLPGARMDGPESVVVTVRWSNGAEHSVHEVALAPPEPEPEPEPEPAPTPKVTVEDEDHGSLVLLDGDEALVACVQTVDAQRVRVAFEEGGLRADRAVEVRASDPDALSLERDGASGDRIVLRGGGEAGGLGFDVRIEVPARFAETPTLRWDGSEPLGSGRSAAGEGASGAPLSVGFQIVERWGEAFFGRVTLTNEGAVELTDWLLELDSFDFELTEAHKAPADPSADGGLLVRAPDWDDTLSPGESFAFGVDGRMVKDPIDLDLEAVMRGLEFDLL